MVTEAEVLTVVGKFIGVGGGRGWCVVHPLWECPLGQGAGRNASETPRLFENALFSAGGNILCAESLTVDYHIPTGRGPSKIDASAPSKSETEAGAMGEHPQRQQRTRVVLYFRVYTDCPEDTQPRVSRPQLHAGNSSQAGSEKRRCRIM